MTTANANESDIMQSIWTGLSGNDSDGPYLAGGKCSACGAVTLGLRRVCPQCWASDTMRELKLGRSGQVYSRTVIHQGPDGFKTPFTAGLVDLAEGIRVFAHLDDGEASPRIGEAVDLQIVQLRTAADGSALSGPRYRKTVNKTVGKTASRSIP